MGARDSHDGSTTTHFVALHLSHMTHGQMFFCLYSLFNFAQRFFISDGPSTQLVLHTAFSSTRSNSSRSLNFQLNSLCMHASVCSVAVYGVCVVSCRVHSFFVFAISSRDISLHSPPFVRSLAYPNNRTMFAFSICVHKPPPLLPHIKSYVIH